MPAGHHHEPHIGAPDDAVKKGHLNIGFQHDFFLAGKPAVGRVGKCLHALKPFFGFLHLADLRPQIFQNGPIDRKAIADFPLLFFRGGFLLIRLGLCGQHRLHIHLFHALQRFLITLERSLQGGKVLFAFIIRILGFLYRFFPCLFLLVQLLQCLICLSF